MSSFNSLQDNLKNFCIETHEYYTSLKTKQQKESQIETIYKSIWQMIQSNKPNEVTFPDGTKGTLSYNYTAAKFSKENFDQFVIASHDLEQYASTVCISLYFKQNIEQIALSWFIFDGNLEKFDSQISAFEKILDTLSKIMTLIFRFSSMYTLPNFHFIFTRNGFICWKEANRGSEFRL